jgi:glycosyltransferase involved in cell wall biosynthesis
MSYSQATTTSKQPLLIVNSHPIQYFAPLYRQLAADPAFRLTVLYCSRHGLQGEVDRQFGTSVKWDIPLLDGYNHVFLRNQSPNPSIYSFWGLLNFSVIKKLWSAPKSIVWVHGWAYATYWLVLIAAKLMGHTVCLRGESPYQLEQRKSSAKQWFRRQVLGRGLFKFVDHFLFIGQQNKAFYVKMGVPIAKLIFCPYAVDNARFQSQDTEMAAQRTQLRRQLGLPIDAFIALYAGKYIEKKRPMDFVRAIQGSQRSDMAAVLMGDGELRHDLEHFIEENALSCVSLTGFINQSAIGMYYAAADVYVMCSTEEETWGLSTNEAMNFGLPLILTDTVGCADDLLLDGQNGYRVPCGAADELAQALDKLAALPSAVRRQMGQCSRQHIGLYSYDAIISSLKSVHLTD